MKVGHRDQPRAAHHQRRHRACSSAGCTPTVGARSTRTTRPIARCRFGAIAKGVGVASAVRRRGHRLRRRAGSRTRTPTTSRLGGVDGFVGDGNLRQAAETVVEAFYSVNLAKALWLSARLPAHREPRLQRRPRPGRHLRREAPCGVLATRALVAAAVVAARDRGYARSSRRPRAPQQPGAGFRGRSPLSVGARRRLVRDGRARHARRARRRGALTIGYAHAPLHVAVRTTARSRLDRRLEPGLRRLRLRRHLRPACACTSTSTCRSSATATSGTVDGHAFTAPPVDLATNPDTLADARLGFDARLVGERSSRFRLGAGVQLFVPSGDRVGLRYRRHVPRAWGAPSSPATSARSPTPGSSASTFARSTRQRRPAAREAASCSSAPPPE